MGNLRPTHSAAPEGFIYVEEFLSAEEEDRLKVLLSELRFTHDTFRGRRLKRAYAQFGSTYISTGRRLTEAPALPAILHQLILKALLRGAMNNDIYSNGGTAPCGL